MIPACSTFEPTMKPGTSWRKTSGMLKASQRLVKRAGLSAGWLSRVPAGRVGWLAAEAREAGDQGLCELRLDVEPLAVVDDLPDHVVHVVRLPRGLGHDLQQLLRHPVDRVVRLADGRLLLAVGGKVGEVLLDLLDAFGVVLHL